MQNYGQPVPKDNNENISNNIFGRGDATASRESERERRLKLRDMERRKRQEGVNLDAGSYGLGSE